MKKKFGLFALVLAVLLCGSLFLLAACDETEEDPADTPATISVTVNGTAQTSGGTYNATVGTAYTFAATASNGNAVTISYVFGDAAAVTLNGTSFTPETAGSYAFTFTAEDATSFTLTLVAAEAEVPQPATISVTVNGTAQTSGGTYNATVGTAYTFAATASNGNAVTISYVFGDAAAVTLNGTSFTPETAGSYAFTFTAEDATSFTLTLVAAEAEVPQPATISVTVNGTAQTSGGTYNATVGTAYTFAATASNGNAVTISYVFGDAAAVTLNGTSFTPETAGSYAFTFTAEDATSFTLTLVAAEAEVPQPATISVTVNGTAQTSGGTYNATVGTAYTFAATASNGNAVTISYVFGDAEAEELEGTSFTPETAGSYAFTFTAEDAANFTLTLVAAEAEVPPAPQYTVTYKLGGHAAADAQVPTEQTVAENTQITLAAAVEAAEGYAFGGWNDGEDTYQAGTEYTVTDNVTMTAVWNVVHTHTYTWEVTQVPTDSAQGSATGTCSGCEAGTDGHTTTVPLPVLTEVDAYTTNVKTPATCTVAKVTTYTYAANTQITFDVTGSVDLSVAGHGTSNLTFTAAKAATCVDDACGAYVYCSVCGKYYAVTAGTSLNDPDLAISTDAQESASAFIDEDTATGHSYGVSYEDGIVTAACSNSGCDSSYTATVTIDGGTGATGTTALSASDFTFNEQTQQFTVRLPKNGYTYDGHTFSGWSVGEQTYTAGQTVTVAAGNTLEIVAQWTAVNVPQISLVVKVDGQHPIETPDGGNMPACVGTKIHYAASVPEGQVTVSYTLNGGDVQSLSAEGEFTFAEAGTYKFVITALGADDYTFTVNVKEHEWEEWEVTSAPSDSETGEISRTCLVTNHIFSLSVPVLTEEGKYTVETVDATCTESGSATYIYNIPSEYGGDTIVAAKVTLPQLEHSGTYAYNAEKQAVVFTCGECSTTIDCEITGLTVTGDASSAYVVDNGDGTYTAYGFTVEAVYTGVGDNPVTEITIPLDDENLAVTAVSASGGYGNSTVTFTYTKTEGSVSDATDNAIYTVYASAAEAGEVTASGFTPYAVSLGTLSGTGEYRFSITMTSRTSYGVYNSWLVTLDPLNEAKADAAIRPDNYILTNFGRGNGQGQAETTAEDFSYTADILSGRTFLNGWTADDTEGEPTTPTGEPTGALDFVILRTFSNGRYTTKVTVTQGTDSAVMTLTEPAAIGNEVRVYLGTDCANYTYTEVLKAQSGIGSVTSIVPSQSAVTVPGGTTLDEVLAIVDVTVNYSGVTLADLKAATECDPQCEPAYSADTDGTYTVTLTYGGQTAQIEITVDADHVHNFVDGVCNGCWARSVTADDYSGVLTPVAIENHDHGTAWWAGTTSDITMADNSAVVLTWENTRDENYFDYVIEGIFNLGGMQGTVPDGQYLDFDQASERTAEWESVTAPTMSGSYTSGTFTPAGTANAGYGSYVATITRIGTTVTVTVEFTPDASTGVQAWTRTATATNCPTGSNMLLHIAGNPFFLDNITAHYGTMAQA